MTKKQIKESLLQRLRQQLLPQLLQAQLQLPRLAHHRHPEQRRTTLAQLVVVHLQRHVTDQDCQCVAREHARGYVDGQVAALPAPHLQEQLQLPHLPRPQPPNLTPQLPQEQLRHRPSALLRRKLHLAFPLQVLADGGPALGHEPRQPDGVLAHGPGLQFPEPHELWQFEGAGGVEQHHQPCAHGPVDVLEQHRQGEEGEPGVGVGQAEEVFGEVEPGGEAVLDVAAQELHQRVDQDRLAVLHYKLLLQRRFRTPAQRTRQLRPQHAPPQQLRHAPRLLPQPPVLEKLREVHPPHRVHHQHARNQVPCLGMHLEGEDHGLADGVLDFLVGEFGLVVEEGVASEEHLVSYHPYTPDIALLVVPTSAQHLRSHRQRGAHERRQELVLLQQLREPEVRQLHLEVLSHQDVVQLEVAVHNTVLPDGLECPAQLHEYAPHLVLGQSSVVVSLDEDVEVGVAAVLEHQVQVMRGLLEVDELDYVLVLDDRQDLQLLVDALQVLLRQILQTDLLDRERTPPAAGLEDSRVGTLTDRTQQDVRTHLPTLLALNRSLHLYNQYLNQLIDHHHTRLFQSEITQPLILSTYALLKYIIQMSKLVENYLLQEPIGKGVYGQVFRAVHQKSKLEYAVKVIPKSSFKANPKLEQLAINEINILSSLRNENIVRFIETLKTPNNFYFVYEYCNGGTLENLLQKRKTLRETEALIIFRQLLEAFKELNKNNIMHRDLKPDNIFFSDGKVKLGDFGFCKMLEVNMAQTMLGSPIYMAPEILKEEIYTLKADIWSLGVVLFEMLFGYCPFESSSISQLINVIKETDLRIPKEINPITEHCETIILKMLVKDQFKRIEWVDLFDFRIDEEGRILSGYKKDLGIEALEKYFLFDLKNDDSHEKKTVLTEATEKPKIKEGIESDKMIYIGRQSVQSKDYMMMRKANSDPISATAHTLATTPIPPTPPVLEKQPEKQQPYVEHFYVEHTRQTHSFVERHNRWLRGVQLLDELADSTDSAQTIFYYLLTVMLREINEQYQNHPEWTDVLLDQKRSLTDALRALGRDEAPSDLEAGKGEMLRIWLRGEERWKMMWGRAIKYILGIEGSHTDIEVLLS